MEQLAAPGMELSLVKDKCSLDPTCAMFYLSDNGNVYGNGYWKCFVGISIKNSIHESTLYRPGKHLFLSALINNKKPYKVQKNKTLHNHNITDGTYILTDGGCINGAIEYKCVGSEIDGKHKVWPECQSSCLCEEHCFWDRCYLKIPPETCLSGTKSSWLWNAKEGFWVAHAQGKSF